MLKINNLRKKFGEQIVLDDISFEASEKEILVIRGKSGAGKTTLIRCICNLEDADSGQIFIDGINMLDRENKKKNADIHQDKVGLVFQNFNLFPHKSILDNLTLSVLCQKLMTKEQAEEKAMKLLERLGIADKAKQYPHQLSGGQKQRVAIARAIMLSPKVLCFDEPTSALDHETTSEVIPIIQSLAQDGMCILIITHDNDFAQKIATRSIEMAGGKFIQS